MLRKVAICAVLATTMVVAGCGSSGDETSEEDTRAITELVDDLNRATQEKDASAFCLIIQPSAVEETFLDIDRCVRETEPILEAAGDQPQLEIENIEVDGDLAKVTFTGSAGGEANFVKEDGRWFVPLTTEGVEATESITSGEEG
ncbi:MAG: hypothetical protein QG596_464 [Actinomycetota bacterium]|nr:hypothetical protein [Actinomycetota bacterium]